MPALSLRVAAKAIGEWVLNAFLAPQPQASP